MNTILEQINSAGSRFVEFALPMFVQSGVLILILLLADFALHKKVRAVFRYWIWMLVLLKLILPTSLSTPVSLGYLFGDEIASVNINHPATETKIPEPAPAIVPPNIDLTNIRTDKFTPTPAPTIPATRPVVTEPAQPPAELVTPLSWQGAVFILWAAVVLTMGLLLLQRAIFVRGLVAQAKEVDDSMADTLKSCRECIRVKRTIGLRVSTNAASPAVCGLFRPVILVPKNLASSLNKSQLRAVLLHELAHIRRGDLWVNLAQTVLQIVYFYNPLLWLANTIIRRTREQAVDEMVLVAMGEKAQQYPQTLVDVAKLAFKRPALSLRLIGVVESKSALAGRIKHILNRPMPKRAKLGILGLLLVIIIAAILLPMAACKPGPPSLVIKGIVKDAQTGEPIAGARVFDDGYGPEPNWEQIKADVRSEGGAITNSAGEYSFLAWPEHHSIKVEAPVYKSERKSLYDGHFIPKTKDTETFNFFLEPEKVSDSSEFKKTLPNGVTVELIGVCEHPSEGKQWWRPNGAILESDYAPSDYSRMTVKPDETEQARELALRFAGQNVEHMSFRWKMDMATRSSSHPFYVTEKREKLKPLRNIVFKLPRNLETLDFSIGIATGEWEGVASGGDGRTVSGTNDSLTDSSVIFQKAAKEKDTVRLCATHLLGGDYDCRIMVVDRDDEIHEPIRSSNSGSDMRLCEGFFDLSPGQIEYILLQARPYEWVEFKNVSLRPGYKTDVKVGVPIVEDVNPTPTRPGIISTPILGYDVKLNFAAPTIRDGSFHSKQSVAFVMSFHSIEDLKPGVLLSGLLIGQRKFSLILEDNRIKIQDGSTGREVDSESWFAEQVQFNKVIILPVKYGQKEYSCPIHVEMDRHGEGVLTGSYRFCAYLSGRLPWGAGGRSFEIVNLDQQMEFRLQGDGTDKRDAVLGIDIDGDGKINPAERGGEQFNLYEPFQIGSKTYRVTEVDPYLPRVVFNEIIPTQPLLPGHKTDVQVEVEGAKSEIPQLVKNSIGTARRYFSRVGVQRTRDTELVKTLREDTELFDEPVGFLVKDYDDGVLHCIDFDNNRIVRIPDELDINGKDSILKWSKEHNIDALFRKASSLVSLNMASTIIAEPEWSELSTRTLVILNKRIPGSTDILYSASGEYHYYAFKTSQGRIGVLGLASLENNGLDHRLLSIKYKLLKPDVQVEVKGEVPKSALPPAMVGTWFFDNPGGDDEQMAIFPDGRVVVLYSNGHRDETHIIDGFIELAEYEGTKYKIAVEENGTLLRHFDAGGSLMISSRWSRIDSQPHTELLRPLTGPDSSKTDVQVEPGQAAKESDTQNQELSFGPAIELEIPLLVRDDDLFQKAGLIDFETGRLFRLPQIYMKLKKELGQDGYETHVSSWCRENGIDAAPIGVWFIEVNAGGVGLVSEEWAGKIFLEVTEESWDSLTPEELLSRLQREQLQGEITFDEVSDTFAFSTIEGNIGLLKALSVTDNSIKIRYKMVQKSTPLRPNLQAEVEPVVGQWEYIGEVIPPDFNDTMILTEHINLGSIGHDAEGKTFITFIRDGKEAQNRQYRFVLFTKNGDILEPDGHVVLGEGKRIEEKLTFDEPFITRQLRGFRFQARPLPPSGVDDDLSSQLQKPFSELIEGKTLLPSVLPPPGRYAVELDGVDDYLLVPDSPTLRLEPPFTIEMWIKTRLPADASEYRGGWAVISKGFTVGTPRAYLTGFGINLQRFPNEPSNLHIDFCKANNSGIYSTTYAGYPLTNGVSDWIHITHVFDGQYYKSAPGHPLVMGKFLIPTENPFKGLLGEVRLWNGARTRQELRQYENVALTGNEPGLAACWTFEQTEGQFAYDISPNNNHARLGKSPGPDNADPKWVDLQKSSPQPGQKTDVQAKIENHLFSVYGTVTDQSGRPIAGVQLTADCGHEKLERTGRAVTDENGRYTLGFTSLVKVLHVDPYDVGIQTARIEARAQGFYEASLCRQGNLAMAGKPPSPDEQRFVAEYAGVVLPHKPYELNFVMHPAARIEGKFVDERGRSILRRSVWLSGDGLLKNTSLSGLSYGNGTFTIDHVPCGTVWFTSINRQLVQSGAVNLATPGTYRVQLQFGESPSGRPTLRIAEFQAPEPSLAESARPRVIDPNGNPVASAQVALCTSNKGVVIRAGKLSPNRMGGRTTTILETDADGSFDFSDRPDDFHLIVAHEKGFAWITREQFTSSPEIRLQSWGRIEGHLYIGRKSAADKKMSLLNYINKNAIDQGVRYEYETDTDAGGKFVFDKVPPGWLEIGYLTRMGNSSWSQTGRTPVQINPGVTLRVAVGGRGRPVVGKFVPPPGYDRPVYFGEGLRALDTLRPERPKPENYDRMTKRQRQQWYNQWSKTPEAGAYYDAMWHDPGRRHYVFHIKKDGSFRIEDVIAGKYQLTVWIEERLTGQGRPEEIAGYYGTIEVPEMPGGRSDEPLDLGELELTMHNPLQVGDIAPSFEAKTLDGKDLKLIDYRGKFVLLSFWQPVFHPEKQQLQELYDTYGGNRQLEIIGLGGNDTLEEIKNYVEENAIPWPQIYTGEEFKSGIAKDYGIPGIPEIFLIGPDGRIIAKDLRDEKLKSVVTETLEAANKNKTDVQIEVEER